MLHSCTHIATVGIKGLGYKISASMVNEDWPMSIRVTKTHSFTSLFHTNCVMDIVAVRIVGSNGSQDTINGYNVRGSASMGSRRGVECRSEHARSLHYAHCGPDCNWPTHVQAQELSHRQGGTQRCRVLSQKIKQIMCLEQSISSSS